MKNLLVLQSQIITNDRLHPDIPGDTRTPEQAIPDKNTVEGQNWETCMTMNNSWGYKKFDNRWKSSETLIRNLVKIAARRGNYLLNIGPKPDGTFPEESVQRLKEIGQWMKVNSEYIYGTAPDAVASVIKIEVKGKVILN
jgi:alpha-L-fucosidase